MCVPHSSLDVEVTKILRPSLPSLCILQAVSFVKKYVDTIDERLERQTELLQSRRPLLQALCAGKTLLLCLCNSLGNFFKVACPRRRHLARPSRLRPSHLRHQCLPLRLESTPPPYPLQHLARLPLRLLRPLALSLCGRGHLAPARQAAQRQLRRVGCLRTSSAIRLSSRLWRKCEHLPRYGGRGSAICCTDTERS